MTTAIFILAVTNTIILIAFGIRKIYNSYSTKKYVEKMEMEIKKEQEVEIKKMKALEKFRELLGK